jgi:uncharacterized membrane protein
MMTVLALAAAFWLAIHIGISGTALRGRLVRALGERAFAGLYSLLSIAALALLIWSFGRAGTQPLWGPLPTLAYWLLAALMLPAFLLFVASLAGANPTLSGQTLGEAGPRGVTRITRHPMMCAFSLWALLHVLGNGDLAALLFFGTFGVTALVGMPSIDAKIAARDPAAWSRLSATTSILPFGAIAAGRNRFVPGEIPWWVWLTGTALWAAMLHFHAGLIGVSPIPGLLL